MGKNNKKMAKALATTMALTLAFGMAGCGSATTEYGDVTVIEVINFGGGVGMEWVTKAAERFSELKKDVSYEEGKTGVQVEIHNTQAIGRGSIKTSGYHIWFDQPNSYGALENLMRQGLFLDITDVVTEANEADGSSIKDKLIDDYEFTLKVDDSYYMLPHYEFYSNASYDKDLFDEYGFYFSDSENGEEYYCSLTGETYYFVNDDYTTKSVGNDGKTGTSDDGMPTTLNELVALCDYMKQIGNVVPFSVAGGHTDYFNSLIHGLWTAMAGYDQTKAIYTHTGTVEYVTGFSNEEIWAGSGIKKPETETVTDLTSETGYKAVDQAARYYAFAFAELAEQQDWVYEKFKQTNYTHKEAMKAFILNGIGNYEEIGAHVECSYWYNEMKSYDLMNTYKSFAGTDETKNIAHWHMPTSYGNDKVTGEENAREEVLVNSIVSYAYVNGNLDDEGGNEGLIKACKDFMKFLYTEEELQAFTATTGIARAKIDYDIDEDVLSQLDPYQQTLMAFRANTRVVQQEADNPTFRANSDRLFYRFSSPGLSPYFKGTEYSTPLMAYVDGYTAAEVFENTGITASEWLSDIYVAE